MKLHTIEGVTIRVNDMEKATKFFSEVLGQEFGSPSESKDIGSLNSLGLGLGASRLGITLLAPSRPDGVVGKTIEKRGEGIQLISLKVANVAQATAELKSHGIRQIAGDGTTMAQFHPQDVFGVHIELVSEEFLRKMGR